MDRETRIIRSMITDPSGYPSKYSSMEKGKGKGKGEDWPIMGELFLRKQPAEGKNE